MTAQFQHGIERFRRRAVREAGWQSVAPRLKLVQQAGQGLHRVSPLLWSTAPIGRPAVSDNHWRLRRHICGSCLAPRPVGRRSLGRGRGAIAAGWWSWHPGLISRDASRVQWICGSPSPVLQSERQLKSRCSGTEIGTPEDTPRFCWKRGCQTPASGRELILGRKRSRTSPSSARIWPITLCQRLRQLEGRVSSRLASRTLCAGEVAGRLWRSLTPAAPPPSRAQSPRVWDLWPGRRNRRCSRTKEHGLAQMMRAAPAWRAGS
jgi:hypothetical protein